ncbi:MAG: DUF4065 domain-containing protein [bacterium]|nr:DUF4065 domain-containing protein [bacterium]
MTVKAIDAASYILQKSGEITAMKLQKLVYYCQAWSLVWDEAPLFDEKLEAWANGPVVRELFNLHRNQFTVSNLPGDLTKLSAPQKETIDSVIKFYGDKSSQWLSDLTHMEEPWKNAREGLAVGERGAREITIASMMDYYSSL